MPVSTLEQEYARLAGDRVSSAYQSRILAEVNQGFSDLVQKLTSSPLASHLRGRVFAGYAPSRRSTATARAVDSGYVILVGEGLVHLSIMASALVAARMHLEDEGTVSGPLLSLDEAHHLFVDVLERAASGREIPPSPVALLPPDRDRYSRVMHAFILMKEAQAFDHTTFFEAHPGTKSMNEMVPIAELESLARRGLEFSRSLVAACVVRHLELGDFKSCYAALRLGATMLVHATRYGKHPSFQEFHALVRRCVPAIDTIVADLRASADVGKLGLLRPRDGG